MQASHTARRFALGATSLLAVAFLLAGGSRAAAQVLIGRILIGGPSDNGVDTGQAYYPGGNGFVPGYGNYPDPYYVNSPQIAINFWKGRAPQAAVQSPTPMPVADPDASVAATAAVVRVRVPAAAEIWFSDSPTTQRGDLRRFITPPLEVGRNQGYEIRARWRQDGKSVERTENVRVHPGDRLTVDFLPAAEQIPAPLDLPRKEGGL